MAGKNIFEAASQVVLTVLSVVVLLIATVGASAQSAPPDLQPHPAAAQPNPASAQTNTGNLPAAAVPAPVTLSGAEGVEKRIGRARALAAAHQLAAAAQELETVRATTTDSVLRHVTSIMLLGIYLEDGNYSRALALLEESFQARTSANGHSLRSYFALSGQALNGARQHLARYRSFGVTIGNAILPAEAVNDLERLRLLLERMVAQANEIIREAPRANDGLALLEDVLSIRALLARDNNDREKWQKDYTQARQQLAFARMQLGMKEESTFQSQPPNPTPAPIKTDATAQNPEVEPSQIVYSGVLNQRASTRVIPAYPQLAKAAGAVGMVKVHVVVDESGNVQITKSEGPVVLRQAAEDAARGWRFSPALVAGKPVKFAGYIEFTFEL